MAESGAEDEEGLLEAARQSAIQQDAWENEGGALATEPNQLTEQGYEKPFPKRERFFGSIKKVSEPQRD